MGVRERERSLVKIEEERETFSNKATNDRKSYKP